MKKTNPKNNKVNITKTILDKLDYLDNLNTQEQYAVFLGKVQIIELGLQKVLVSHYSYNENKIETFTLGQLIGSLEKSNAQKVFIELLKELNDRRKYIVHHLFKDQAIMLNLMGKEKRIKDFLQRKEEKMLFHGFVAVENIIYLYDMIYTKK